MPTYKLKVQLHYINIKSNSSWDLQEIQVPAHKTVRDIIPENFDSSYEQGAAGILHAPNTTKNRFA